VADTGLPWELPYPLPTDLVRDGADAIKDLAEATADGLNAAGNAGIGSNVVSAFKANAFATSSTTYVDITDLEVTITPSSDTAKVLCMAQISLGHDNANGVLLVQLRRGSTDIAVSTAGGTRNGTSAGTQPSGQPSAPTFSVVFLDSPATDTATTYKLRMQTASGTARVNNAAGTANGSTSSLVVIEVAP
jgi:hypothetical protein